MFWKASKKLTAVLGRYGRHNRYQAAGKGRKRRSGLKNRLVNHGRFYILAG
jgi:hypothetical protein